MDPSQRSRTPTVGRGRGPLGPPFCAFLGSACCAAIWSWSALAFASGPESSRSLDPVVSPAATPRRVLPASALERHAAHPAVVRIAASGSDSISYGSGTLVGASDQQGLVITNWHVINEATGPITVLFPDGFQSPATVQKVDREWDLAALAVRRPRAQPAPIASEPARPGDLLTIAGYGAGQYRAVTGRCTQYVAPGMTFPYEMVELAAAARRGDSGGPIFNARGELVGVLFGEGGGRTTGSYCGRVRWFLDSLLSKELSAAEPGEAERLADQRPRGAPGARVASLAPAVERRQQTARNDPAAVASGELEPANFRSALTKRSDAAIRVLSSPDDGRPPRTTTDRPAGISAPAAAITGESPAPSSFDLPTFAEIEAVLAAIGGFALLAQITRWLGTSGAAR